ncbi:MAG: hypothetical protein FJ388_01365 [Verrucomicrobia bacterium]|nr:hypothetical protein [Verrucomicrobiota bacterium]
MSTWAEELRLPRATVATIFLLPLLIFGAAHVVMFTDAGLFRELTRKAYWFGPVAPPPAAAQARTADDEEFYWSKHAWRFERGFGPINVAEFAAVAVAAVLAFRIFLHARRTGRTRLAALYLAIALGSALIAADEVRWGQSFGLNLFPQDVVETIRSRNRQGELTLHNQPGVMDFVKKAITLLAIWGLGAGLYVARKHRDWFQEKAFYWFLPHPVLAPGFAIVLFYDVERLVYRLVTGSRPRGAWSAMQEPAELVAVMAFMWFCWFALRAVKRWPQGAAPRENGVTR